MFSSYRVFEFPFDRKRQKLLMMLGYIFLFGVAFGQDDLAEFKEQLKAINQSKVEETFSTIKTAARALSSDLEKANRYLLIGEAEEMSWGRQDSARWYYSQAKHLFDKVGAFQKAGEALRNIAFTFQTDGDLDEAIRQFELARDIYLNAGDTAMYFGMINNIGNVYLDKGEVDTARGLLLTAAESCPPGKASLNCGNVMSNLGRVFLISGDYERGILWGKRSLDLLGQANAHQNLGNALNTIAGCFFYLQQFDSVSHYMDKAIAQYEQAGNPNGMAMAGNNLGALALDQKNYAVAKDRLAAALTAAKKTQNRSLQSNIYTNLSKALFYLGQKESAFVFLDSAMNMAAGQKNETLEVYKVTAELKEDAGQYADALRAFKQYKMYQDSISNTDKASLYAEMETKYGIAIKDQEIAEQKLLIAEKEQTVQRVFFVTVLLLILVLALATIYFLAKSRQRKVLQVLEQEMEIEVKEAYLQAAMESQESERKRFAQDLHDGFGQLLSALRMQISNLKPQGEREENLAVVEKSEKILDEMHREIRQIAFNLMPATLIQYGLKPAIMEFAGRLKETGKIMVETDLQAFEGRLEELQEINLYRIIQEWVNNVLKYAQAKKINIQIVLHEEELNLLIEDDGKGFDPGILEQSSGNGWKNIQSRVRRLQGNLEVDSREGAVGSSFILDIPLVYQEDSEMTVVEK